MNSPVIYYSFHGILQEVTDHLPFSDESERSKALSWAASHGFYNIVRVLLEFGCDIHQNLPGQMSPYKRCCAWGKPLFDMGFSRDPFDKETTKRLIEDYMFMETCSKIPPRLFIDACLFGPVRQPSRNTMLQVWANIYPENRHLPPKEIDWTHFIVCAPDVLVQWIKEKF